MKGPFWVDLKPPQQDSMGTDSCWGASAPHSTEQRRPPKLGSTLPEGSCPSPLLTRSEV